MKILHEACDPELAKNNSLPYTAYLISYNTEEGIKYDIATSSKKSELFDYYWDKYKSVLNMVQTDGKINPKLWNDPSKPAKKK